MMSIPNDNRSIVYVWEPETATILEFNREELYEVPEEFRDKFCVDTNFIDSPSIRYGKWETKSDKDSDNILIVRWNHYPFRIFPIEFKTNLLLLGVS